MTRRGRLARWETWVTVGGVLVLVLVLVGVDIALFERNRGVQAELAARQQFIQQTGSWRMQRTRSSRFVDQSDSSKARRAAAIAASMSAAVPSGATPISCPFAGFRIG